MNNDIERELFEQRFPVPAGIYWNDTSEQYDPLPGVAGLDVEVYHGQWMGWQAARLSTPATPQADGWVRCEDRLPEFTGWYLVTLTDPDDIGWSTSVSWAAFWNGDAFEECDPVEDGQPVTHWMPFPQPPKQEGSAHG